MDLDPNRQRLIDDHKALRNSIKRALALGDEKEVDRLTRHLLWLNGYLKNNEKED